MIELQEYLDAGFTPAQAQLLLQRDLRWQQSIESLRSDVQDGFSKLRAEVVAGFNQVAAGFNQVADLMAEHHAENDVRLAAIEQAIRERPTNGHNP